VLSVLVEAPRAEQLTQAIFRETSSIGVRRVPVTRSERPRQSVSVETPFGPVSVKVSDGDYGPPQVKPEFDECAALARKSGVPVREVIAQALAAYENRRFSRPA
jgi:uncharacterized protein (DUF111 family)